MQEDLVKGLVEVWLKRKGYTWKSEVGVTGTDREVIMDYYAYREQEGEPKILWVECKGDQNLSELLEGFIRLEFAVYYGGGNGILALPHKAAERLLNYKDFLIQAQNILAILDVEHGKVHKLKSDSDVVKHSATFQPTSS